MRFACLIQHDLAVPPEAQEAITRAGGRNVYGEPNYRFAWGGSRLAWAWGEWCDRLGDDERGDVWRRTVEARLVPAYPQREVFHVERWVPAPPPTLWRLATTEALGVQTVETLGPYPERGEYQHLLVLEGPRGEFVRPTRAIAERVVLLHRAALAASRGERAAVAAMREEARQRAKDQRVQDVLDDRTAAFNWCPNTTDVKPWAGLVTGPPAAGGTDAGNAVQ